MADLTNNSNHLTAISTDECQDLQLISKSEVCAPEQIHIAKIDPVECPGLITGQDRPSASIMAMAKKPIPPIRSA